MIELWAIVFMLHGNPYVSMDMWTANDKCIEVLKERYGRGEIPDGAGCVLLERRLERK